MVRVRVKHLPGQGREEEKRGRQGEGRERMSQLTGTPAAPQESAGGCIMLARLMGRANIALWAR